MTKHRDEPDTLEVTFEQELGVPGTDDDPATPFARAVRRLLHDGRPLARLGKTFFSTRPPDSDLHEGDLRWLGVFIVSDGDRLIFFPGTAEPLTASRSYRGDRIDWEGDFPLDHLSLDPGRGSWHVTTAGSMEHLAAARTLDLGGGRVLWCSLQFHSASVLPPVRRVTTVRAPVPPSDARRRKDVLVASRDDVSFPIVSAPRHPDVALAGGVLHVAIVVGPPGFEPYQGPHLGWPLDSPFMVKSVPPDMRGQPIRTHRLSLRPEADIEITACWIRGELGRPAVLAGQPDARPVGS